MVTLTGKTVHCSLGEYFKTKPYLEVAKNRFLLREKADRGSLGGGGKGLVKCSTAGTEMGSLELRPTAAGKVFSN